MNVACILAGGIGRRAMEAKPKQFVEIQGKPIIVYTLEKFENCISIDAICVVCTENWVKRMWQYATAFGIRKLKWVCTGGETGLKSVKRGIDTLSELNDQDIVLVHDSVRPFVDEKSIIDSIDLAQRRGVAVSSVACVETLVKADEKMEAENMISRENLYRVLTPQTFRMGVIRNIISDPDYDNSDMPSIFAFYMNKGNAVYCSYGSEKNIKITYPSDIEYFRQLF